MTAPDEHYWKLGMVVPAGQSYKNNLCGSDSVNYTENEAEVTCERCLAALRARSGPAPASRSGEASSVVSQTFTLDVLSLPAVVEHVHAAVVAERLEIVDIIRRVYQDANVPRPLVVRRILERIAKRT